MKRERTGPIFSPYPLRATLGTDGLNPIRANEAVEDTPPERTAAF